MIARHANNLQRSAGTVASAHAGACHAGLMRAAILLGIALFAAACTPVPKDGDFKAVEGLVAGRLAARVYWYQGGPEDELVRRQGEALLAQPLDLPASVQFALLNNYRLQAEYEDLGVAQADLVQAGLLSNPVFFGKLRPVHGHGKPNSEFGLAAEFIDLLMRPARQRIAAADFSRTKLRVAGSILALTADVSRAWYATQAAQRLVEILAGVHESASASELLARRYQEAGNMSRRELTEQRSVVAEVRAELLAAEGALQARRDRLSALMGIGGSGQHWSLAGTLPELPAADPGAAEMLAGALSGRLDLQEIGEEFRQLDSALEMTRRFRYIGGATVGISTERDTDGSRVTGPDFSVELPLFDQRQAQLARLESLRRQSEMRRRALENEVRAEVDSALHRMAAARRLAGHYGSELIPAHEEMLQYLQQEQQYMLVDAFAVLAAHRQLRAARRGYTQAIADYWDARVDLDLAMGGNAAATTAAAGE